MYTQIVFLQKLQRICMCKTDIIGILFQENVVQNHKISLKCRAITNKFRVLSNPWLIPHIKIPKYNFHCNAFIYLLERAYAQTSRLAPNK